MSVDFAERVTSVSNDVKNTSFEEKRHSPTEEEINTFLDTINDLKKFLGGKTKKLDKLTGGLESLTWMTDVNDEVLMTLNNLIGSARDLRRTLILNYVKFNKKVKSRGIAVSEINDFKRSIDDFTEVINDVESVFFILPNNKSFIEATNRLSNI